MDPEIQTLINIWLIAIVSLIYCHQIAAQISSCATRLLSLLPVLYLFTTLPLRLTSIHLGRATIFYLVWLGNFKLLLFSFNRGPLSSTPPLSLFHFIFVAVLPIKTNSQTKHASSPKILNPIHFLFKSRLVAVIVFLYRYREFMHSYLILVLYCIHLYLAVELILAISAAPVRGVFRLDLEPQFDEPYLATSLQNFWGRRWNLMVTSILRPTVYLPVRGICMRILGRRWALPPAILATFLVSGLMHEVLYYYVTRGRSLGSLFYMGFVWLLKKVLSGGLRLHRAVSGVLTVGFVVVTGDWLFLPQVLRNGVDL